MKKLLFAFVIAAGASACSPTAYYVANVYNANGTLFVQKCAIDSGRNSDKPDPSNCKFEPVGAPPPELQQYMATPPQPPAAPAASTGAAPGVAL